MLAMTRREQYVVGLFWACIRSLLTCSRPLLLATFERSGLREENNVQDYLIYEKHHYGLRHLLKRRICSLV
jgi:hypothetical protein